MICQSSRFTEVDDEWWFYYSGHKQRHVATDDGFDGIGLATMPKGRLIGMKPDGANGAATTRRMQPGRGPFWVNADGRNGSIRVTVLNGGGDAPQEPSDPVSSDGVRTPVTWNGRSWDGGGDTELQVRFELENGAYLWECGWGA